MIEYEKVFCPDLNYGPDIFDYPGLDRGNVALVVVRHEQFIAKIQPLDDCVGLAGFFDGFICPAASDQ